MNFLYPRIAYDQSAAFAVVIGWSIHDHLQTGQGRNYTDAERFAQVAGLGFLYGTKRNQEELTIGYNNKLISTKMGNYWSKNDVMKDGEEFSVNGSLRMFTAVNSNLFMGFHEG